MLLPPLFIGEVSRWIRAKPGAAGTEGFPSFRRKEGMLPPALRATPLINEGGKAYSVKYQFNRFPKAKKLGSPEGLPNTSILALVGIRVNTHVGEKIENLYFQQAKCDGFIQYCALK